MTGGYPYDPSASMNPYGQQHQLQAPYPTQQPAAPAAPEGTYRHSFLVICLTPMHTIVCIRHKLLLSSLIHTYIIVEIPSDPTAYYNDYWHYASYYGEAAARLYYGAWSPPEGTPPPPGVVVVAEPPTSAASDTTQSDGAVYSESQQQQQQDYATSQAAVPTTAAAATAATVVSAEDTTSSVSSSDNAAADSDPNAAALAWDKYKKEYADWYEAYGKATGADPNPPDM